MEVLSRVYVFINYLLNQSHTTLEEEQSVGAVVCTTDLVLKGAFCNKIIVMIL